MQPSDFMPHSDLYSTLATSCAQCGFHQSHCLCAATPEITSALQFKILCHTTEFKRLSNTGRLIAQTMPQSQISLWQRKHPPQALLDLIADPNQQCILVFPSEKAKSLESWRATHRALSPRNLHFILLDATWQQARKMYRQSPWLHDLPAIQLTPKHQSEYQLRRNQVSGSLCTCEVAIELLHQYHETDNANRLQAYFHHFMRHYRARKGSL